jgi:hypothetical protein
MVLPTIFEYYTKFNQNDAAEWPNVYRLNDFVAQQFLIFIKMELKTMRQSRLINVEIKLQMNQVQGT